ncbi:hypothetical protein [Flavobacterium sp.]
MKLLLGAIVFASFISCKQKEENTIIPVNMSDTIVTEEDQSKSKIKQVEDTIHLDFIDEKGLITAEGSIDSIHPRIYVTFQIDNLGKLRARIFPETKTGNIRFNQIVFPDQTSDGPFGAGLDLELTQTGRHSLIIGHSLMAEKPYFGNFRVELQINSE